METLTENIEKLPKWAQSEIKVLQMRLREAKEELKRITENAPSNTVVGFDSPILNGRIDYLKENQMITFKLPKGSISARIENDYLLLQSSSADAEMFVKPLVSNSVKIFLLD